LDQQGFHLAHGSRTHEAFNLLWDNFEKASMTTQDGREVECITFQTFKQIIQRLKIEVLFLHRVISPRVTVNEWGSRPGTPVHAIYLATEDTGTGKLSFVDYSQVRKSLFPWRDHRTISDVFIPLPSLSLSLSLSSEQRKFKAEVPASDPYNFFVTHRPSGFTMRWVHQEGVDRLNVLRLVVTVEVCHGIYHGY